MIDPTQTQPLPIGMHRAGEPWEETPAKPANRQPGTSEAALPDRLADRGYRLRARIGGGRLGAIYEAQDDLSQSSGSEHFVAIQLLDEKIISQPGFASDFERGAVELQSISHPNIVKLLEYGRDGNRYYLVMELLESASLRFVLNDVTELPLEETAAVVRAVGDALQYLHAKSIVHGNLKPENVLVTFGYEVKLLDVAPSGWLTNGGNEAAASGRPKPDTRDDVYGLACLAYEMLTGRHPFNANTAQEAYRAGLEPASIAKLNARQWRALSGALALHRDDRTPNVAQFLHDFGVADIERLREIVTAGDEPPPRAAAVVQQPTATYAQPADPYAQPAVPLTAERFTPYGPRRSGIVGKTMLLLAVIGIGALSYIYQDRLREGTASLMASIEASRSGDSTATPDVETNVPETAAPLPRVAETVTDPAPAMVLAPGATAPKTASVGADAPATIAPYSVAPTTAAPEAAPVASIPAAVAPAVNTPAATPGVTRFSFLQPVATVRESEVAARIVIRRSGDATGAATIAWWTGDDTAIADEDYADLGARVERFAPGEQSRTVFVPLINDTVAGSTKSFNVYLGRGESAQSGSPLSGMRVDIVDDD
ncbi:MAG: protein kinase domain-containing protein [Steroidobacteraceae bacterium]